LRDWRKRKKIAHLTVFRNIIDELKHDLDDKKNEAQIRLKNDDKDGIFTVESLFESILKECEEIYSKQSKRDADDY